MLLLLKNKEIIAGCKYFRKNATFLKEYEGEGTRTMVTTSSPMSFALGIEFQQ